MTARYGWCGFLGAWLLFGGPIYQASLELREPAAKDQVAPARATATTTAA